MNWDNQDFSHIPSRSKLYNLEPIAVRTPYVEGLISCICRLAEAHHVSPSVLLKEAILPTFREHYSTSFGAIYSWHEDGCKVSISSISKPEYRKNPNEFGLLAWQYVEALRILTLRQDLHMLVIPAKANELLTEIQGEAARNLRYWCPDCYCDWRSNNQTIYEPLLWSLSILTICPIHQKPLQFRCPHCQKAQKPLTGRMLVGRCSQCFSWLDTYQDQDANIDQSMDIEKEVTLAEKIRQAFTSWQAT